jgi:hypothetical protein
MALLDSTVKVFYADMLKFFLSLYGHKVSLSFCPFCVYVLALVCLYVWLYVCLHRLSANSCQF